MKKIEIFIIFLFYNNWNGKNCQAKLILTKNRKIKYINKLYG